MSKTSISSSFPGHNSAAAHYRTPGRSEPSASSSGCCGGDGCGLGASSNADPRAAPSCMPDLVLTPLSTNGLEEARVQGWGKRSLDLGSEPAIDGRVLYQLRALLFARRALVSLAVPALPDAMQVYKGVEIPSLLELTVRCSPDEDADILGTLQAFADSPAHAGVTTLRIDGATALPAALGRLPHNSALRHFLAGIRFFSISGNDAPVPGEYGLKRELFVFVAAMPALRKFAYGGYVPGLPAFQALRALTFAAKNLESLTVAQGASNGPACEDAHLHAALCGLDAATGPSLDLALGAALDAPEVAKFAGRPRARSGPRICCLDLTVTPSAVRALAAVCRANAATLRDLRIAVLPADDEETAMMWAAFADAAAEARVLDVVHFVPLIARTAPCNAVACVVRVARTAVEVRVHAPGAAEGPDAREAYLAALCAAEGCGRLRWLWLCVESGAVGEDVLEARERLLRKAGSEVVVAIGKGIPGDGEYEPVKLVNPKRVQWLGPTQFLVTPWLSDLLIAALVGLVMAIVGAIALAIALVTVPKVKKKS